MKFKINSEMMKHKNNTKREQGKLEIEGKINPNAELIDP